MCHLRVLPGRRCWTVPSPSGSRGEGKALPGSLLYYLWLQRTLRSRLVFCVMSLMGQGAHRGRPVAAAPCTPGLRPATSPLRGAFDLSLQASGRAEAASVPAKHGPQPASMRAAPACRERLSDVEAATPAVSVAQVVKLTAGCCGP